MSDIQARRTEQHEDQEQTERDFEGVEKQKPVLTSRCQSSSKKTKRGDRRRHGSHDEIQGRKIRKTDKR